MDTLTDIFDPAQKQQHDDFVRRYESGPPWAQFNDQEAIDEYRRVTPQLSESDYRDSARDAYERLTPEERRKFGRWMRKHAREQGTMVPDLDGDGVDDRLQDSGHLANATTQLRTQQPSFLDNLFGNALGGNANGQGAQGGLGGLLNSPIARAAIGGIAAMAFSRLMHR